MSSIDDDYAQAPTACHAAVLMGERYGVSLKSRLTPERIEKLYAGGILTGDERKLLETLCQQVLIGSKFTYVALCGRATEHMRETEAECQKPKPKHMATEYELSFAHHMLDFLRALNAILPS